MRTVLVNSCEVKGVMLLHAHKLLEYFFQPQSQHGMKHISSAVIDSTTNLTSVTSVQTVWHNQYSLSSVFIAWYLVLWVIGRNAYCCHRTFQSVGIICNRVEGFFSFPCFASFFFFLLMPHLNGNSLGCILGGCAEHAVVMIDKKEWGHRGRQCAPIITLTATMS